MKTLWGVFFLVVLLVVPGYAANEDQVQRGPAKVVETESRGKQETGKSVERENGDKKDSARSEAERFAKKKTGELERLDRKIAKQQQELAEMQRERSCAQAATTDEGLKDCHKQAQADRKDDAKAGDGDKHKDERQEKASSKDDAREKAKERTNVGGKDANR
jgi:hypothetical protein